MREKNQKRKYEIQYLTGVCGYQTAQQDTQMDANTKQRKHHCIHLRLVSTSTHTQLVHMRCGTLSRTAL